ncbi:hypothetical protein BJ508DRAFT_331250 [Ascobolus immersus RN42]|uniref:Uncharacterized protein n=1 Tax=Ascobolus immersus RN42 TaxID=1160509 RepID=A0A3N4HR22_ASCIM|nr:hypothetical protein BJ508DRAFT_331250 [Ascobolus immersus RN42]
MILFSLVPIICLVLAGIPTTVTGFPRRDRELEELRFQEFGFEGNGYWEEYYVCLERNYLAMKEDRFYGALRNLNIPCKPLFNETSKPCMHIRFRDGHMNPEKLLKLPYVISVNSSKPSDYEFPADYWEPIRPWSLWSAPHEYKPRLGDLELYTCVGTEEECFLEWQSYKHWFYTVNGHWPVRLDEIFI